jgi:hypothetical protein
MSSPNFLLRRNGLNLRLRRGSRRSRRIVKERIVPAFTVMQWPKRRRRFALTRGQKNVTLVNKTDDNQGVSCLVAFGSLLALTSVSDDDRRRDPRGFDSRDRNSRPAYQNGIPTGPRADRDKPATSHRSSMAPPPPPASASTAQQGTAPKQAPTTEQISADSNMSSAELSAIRSRYLGVDKKKRQIRKMSDRKFVFDWSEQDDTFSSDSPSAVGGARQGAAVMFGRGHLAGMDLDAAHAAVASGGRLGSGDRKKGAVDERHWSDKPLSEMKERDWRIFREDFSITARGTIFFSGDS